MKFIETAKSVSFLSQTKFIQAKKTMGSTSSSSQRISEEEIVNPSQLCVVNSNDFTTAYGANENNDETTTTTTSFSTSSNQKEEDNPHADYRILALEGDSGCVFCRVHGDMQKTLPK